MQSVVYGYVAHWDRAGYGYARDYEGRYYFLHHTSFGGGDLNVGNEIRGVVEPNPHQPGYPTLVQVERRPGSVVGSSWRPMGWYSCLVSQWHPGRGYGLLVAQGTDVEELGRPIFVHARAFGGGDLKVGEMVDATLEWNKAYPRGPLLAARMVRRDRSESGWSGWNSGWGDSGWSDGDPFWDHAQCLLCFFELRFITTNTTLCDCNCNPGTLVTNQFINAQFIYNRFVSVTPFLKFTYCLYVGLPHYNLLVQAVIDCLYSTWAVEL